MRISFEIGAVLVASALLSGCATPRMYSGKPRPPGEVAVVVTNPDHHLWIESIDGWTPRPGTDRCEVLPGRHLVWISPQVGFLFGPDHLWLEAAPGHVYRLRTVRDKKGAEKLQLDDAGPAGRPDDAPPAGEIDRACRAGQASSCLELGELYERGSMQLGWDESRAAALFKQACAAGLPAGCFSRARLLETGHGGAKDEKAASELFERACASGELRACIRVGLRLTDGPAEQRDQRRASELFKKACQGGETGACYWVAVFEQENQAENTDYGSLPALYQRACTGGEPRACARLGLLYEDGLGVELSEQRAAELYEKACAEGAGQGCANLGWLYQLGRGVERDERRAARWLKKGCDQGVARACTDLASMAKKATGASHFAIREIAEAPASPREDSPPGFWQISVRGEWDPSRPAFFSALSLEQGSPWYSLGLTGVMRLDPAVRPEAFRVYVRVFPLTVGLVRPYLNLSVGISRYAWPVRLTAGVDVRIFHLHLFAELFPFHPADTTGFVDPALLSAGVGWRI